MPEVARVRISGVESGKIAEKIWIQDWIWSAIFQDYLIQVRIEVVNTTAVYFTITAGGCKT